MKYKKIKKDRTYRPKNVSRSGALTYTGHRNVMIGPRSRARPGRLNISPRIQSMGWYGNPFPPEMYTTFTYATNYTITSTFGVPQHHLFTSNSIYDSDFSGGGASVRNFRSLLGANNSDAPYNKYRVIKSTINVKAINTSDTHLARGYLGVAIFNSTSTSASTLSEMNARPDYKIKFVGLSTGGREIAKIVRTCDHKLLFAVKDLKDDEDTAGSYNSNPAKVGRFCISFVPANETSGGTLQVLVRIVYKVQLFSMNDVLDS